MKKNIASNTALVCLLLAIGVSIYMTNHHYDLMFGARDSKSFCSISSTIDCDAVNISKYSEVGGISIALIGLFAYIAELLLLFGFKAYSVDEKPKIARFLFYISFLGVLMSLYLAFVSTFNLKTFCMFCTALHVINFVIAWCAYSLVGGKVFKELKSDLLSLIKGGEEGSRGMLLIMII